MRGGGDVASNDNEWPMPSVEDVNSDLSGDVLPTAVLASPLPAHTSSETRDSPIACVPGAISDLAEPTEPHVLSILSEGTIHEKVMTLLDRLSIPELFIDISGNSDQERFIDEAGWPKLRDRFSSMVHTGSIRSAILSHPGAEHVDQPSSKYRLDPEAKKVTRQAAALFIRLVAVSLCSSQLVSHHS